MLAPPANPKIIRKNTINENDEPNVSVRIFLL